MIRDVTAGAELRVRQTVNRRAALSGQDSDLLNWSPSLVNRFYTIWYITSYRFNWLPSDIYGNLEESHGY